MGDAGGELAHDGHLPGLFHSAKHVPDLIHHEPESRRQTSDLVGSGGWQRRVQVSPAHTLRRFGECLQGGRGAVGGDDERATHEGSQEKHDEQISPPRTPEGGRELV